MSNQISRLHHYWSRAVAYEYDARAGWVADFSAGQKLALATAKGRHDHIQRLEYDDMSNLQFDLRIKLSIAVNGLTARWFDVGRRIVDVFGSRPLASGRGNAENGPIEFKLAQPIYPHFGPEGDHRLAQDQATFVDGAFSESENRKTMRFSSVGSSHDVGPATRKISANSIEIRMAHPSGVLPSISAISRSSGPVTARIVRVATLV